MRTQEICSIVCSDILSAGINDGNYLGEKNNPVLHEPIGLTFPDLWNQRDPHRPYLNAGDMKNSSQVTVNGQDDRILLDKIRALKERIHLLPEEVPEMVHS